MGWWLLLSACGGEVGSSAPGGEGGSAGAILEPSSGGAGVALGGRRGVGGEEFWIEMVGGNLSLVGVGGIANSTCIEPDNCRTCLLHVSVEGSNTQDGTSWERSLASLQLALDLGQATVNDAALGFDSCEVWVKEGTYVPEGADPGQATFQLRPNVVVRGGFAGTETLQSQRVPGQHTTILSGERADVDARVGSVVTGAAGAILDRVTVRGGGYGVRSYEGSFSLTDCIVWENGTGIRLFERSSGVVRLSNCLIAKNHYGLESGGRSGGATFDLVNTTVAHNASCGFVLGYWAELWAINSVIWGNDPADLDCIYGLDYGEMRMMPTVGCGYSIVEPGYRNVLASAEDPRFVDPDQGDFRLAPDSPAIDAGSACGELVPMVDLLGQPRWDLASRGTDPNGIDLGAFEVQGTAGTDTLIFSPTCSE